ncbi:MAG: hypothetical protein ACR2IE_10070 [Candidatus Sumerlaeaceae bacterium]
MLKKTPRIRITENVNLLLASFALAFLTWVFAKSGEVQEANLYVPVSIASVDPRYEVEVQPPTMLVRVRYGKEAAPYINSENFRFQVDTADLRQNLGVEWKAKSMPLSEKDLIANIPSRFDVVKIGTQSNTVDVRMRYHALAATVEADIAGADRLPEGYQLVTPVKVSPNEVWLSGDMDILKNVPRDDVTSRVRLTTERINIAGHKQSSLETVPIKLPPGVELVQRQSNTAEVNIEIQEVQTVREIRGVKLDFQAVAADSVQLQYQEKSATVSVFGPQSMIKQLTPDSLKIMLIRPPEEVPGTAVDLPLEAHFAPAVSEDVRARVTIRSIEPKIIHVQYVAGGKTEAAAPDPTTTEPLVP